MFGIGEGELIIIALFAFMIFGPDKLPGMGRTLGRALRQFRNAQEGFTEVVQTNIVDPAAEAMSDSPKKPTRRRSEELDEDADIELAEGEEAPRPKRAETFAERKKRLAEEKAAREAAEKQAALAADEDADPSDEDADSDEAEAKTGAADGEAADKPATEAPAPAPAPAKPSVSDLYTMRRPSRPAAPATGDSDAGVSPSASREASEEHSDERRAAGSDPSVEIAGDNATTDEKEA